MSPEKAIAAINANTGNLGLLRDMVIDMAQQFRKESDQHAERVAELTRCCAGLVEVVKRQGAEISALQARRGAAE